MFKTLPIVLKTLFKTVSKICSKLRRTASRLPLIIDSLK